MPIALKTSLPLLLMAVAALALSGASQAHADVLCEAELVATEEGEACLEPFPEGEELKAAAKEAKLVGTEFEVKCESSMTLVSGEDLGLKKGLTGKATALSFSGCKGSCTKASAANLPYKTLMTASSEGDGSVEVSAIEKEPSITVEGCTAGKCTYGTAKLSMSFSGGEPAIAEASSAALKRTAGLCPTEVTLTAAYTFQQPGGGRAFEAGRDDAATVLCKNQLNPCRPATERYGATQAFEAKVEAPGIVFKWNGADKDTCTTSVLKGTTETIASPMLAKVTAWSFSNCTCTTSATRLSWAAVIKAIAFTDRGLVSLSSGGSGDPVLEMLGCGGVNCNFAKFTGTEWFKGGSLATTPAKIEFNGNKLAELSGGCGDVEIKTGVFKVEMPDPVWVEPA
jgi:hypothetical protein